MNKDSHKMVLQALSYICNPSVINCDISYYDEPLTGPFFRLSGVDLLYLLWLLEDMTHKKLDRTLIYKGYFHTVNQISVLLSH